MTVNVVLQPDGLTHTIIDYVSLGWKGPVAFERKVDYAHSRNGTNTWRVQFAATSAGAHSRSILSAWVGVTNASAHAQSFGTVIRPNAIALNSIIVFVDSV